MNAYEEAMRRLREKYTGSGGAAVTHSAVLTPAAPSDDPYKAAADSLANKYGVRTPQVTKPSALPKPEPTAQSFDESPDLVTPMPELPKYQPYLMERIAEEVKTVTPATPKEIKEWQKGQTTSTAQRYRLAGDIESGKVKIADLSPEQVPWDQLMARPGYTQVAALGLRDPQKAYAYLVELQGKMTGTAEERQSLQPPSFAQGFAQGAASGLALGLPEQAPGRTPAERAGQFAGNVVGMIPGVVAAGATGGAAATKLVPQALQKGLLGKVITGAVAGAGTGATLGAAQETARTVKTGEVNLPEQAKNIGEQAGTYGAFGAAYPLASAAVGRAGQAIASRAPSAEKAAESVAQKVPLVGDVVEGGVTGALAGGLVATVQGIGKAALSKDPEVRTAADFVRQVLAGAQEEASEEIVEAVAYGIARGIVGRNVPAVRAAVNQAKAEVAQQAEAPATSTEAPQTAPAPEAEVPPTATQEAPPAPSQTQAEAPSKRQVRFEMLRTANPGMDEKAILQLVRDTDNLSDEEFAAFVERMSTPQEPAKVDTYRVTETAPEPAVEVEGEPILSSQVKKPIETPKTFGDTVKVGDKVGFDFREGVFTVVDTSDPSFLQVRDEKGAVMPVGRARVKPVEQATTEPAPVAQAGPQVEPQVPSAAAPTEQTPAKEVPAQQAEVTVPPATVAEMRKPLTMTQLRERAEQAADRIGTTLEKFVQNPHGWKGILTNPTSPLHRYWLQMKMQEMGKTLPQKVSDLMVELSSVLSSGSGRSRAVEIKRVQDELTAAVESALKDEKTFVERLLAGEEAIPLTGKPVPPGVAEGRVAQPTPAKAEAPKPQQVSIFDRGTSEQLASLREELAGVRKERTDAVAQWNAMVQEVANSLAKDATTINESERKAFWQRIKDHGYIGPSKSHREDFYGRLPASVNFLKRKDGTPLDVLALDMGYESEDALIRDILAFANMSKVDPRKVWSEAESIVVGTQAGADLKALLDYYREAEAAVEMAIAELEGGTHEETGKTETAGEGGHARGAAEAVRGDGSAHREGSQGAGSTTRVKEEVNRQTQGFGGVRPSIPRSATQPLPPIKRREIVNFLNKRFGKMKVGGVRRWFLGQFNTKTGVIRTKMAEDFPVQMHEVGHKLDQELGLSNAEFDKELMALGEQTTPASLLNNRGYRRAEGVAEFLRLYLMDPTEAQKQAPSYYAAFEAKMAANPDIHDQLLEARRMVQRWAGQTAKDRILGAISIGERESWFQRTFGDRKTFPTRLYAKLVDEIAPLEVITKQLSGGKPLKIDEDPFKLAWLARGWAGKAETFLEYGVVDDNFKKVGEPLKAILDEVEDLDDFRAYLAAKRTKELMKKRGFDIEQALGVGVKESDVDEVLKELEPKYGQLQKRLVKFQDAVLQELVKSGVVSEDGAKAMRKMNEEYVPFYRVMDENLGTFDFAGATRFANVSSPIRPIRGSGRTIIDPIESVIKNTYSMLNIATRNNVGRKLVELAEKTDGLGGVVEKVSAPVRPVQFQLAQIRKALADNGVDTEGVDLESIVTIFAPTGRPRARDHQITVMRNGKKEYYEVDPEVYRALLGLDSETTNTYVKLFSYPARLLRAGAILNPDFLGTNPVRDQATAFLNSEYGYIPVFDFWRGFFDAVGKTDTYYKWLSSGGAQASLVSMDRDSLQKKMRKFLKEERKKQSLPGKVWRAVKSPVTALQNLSELMEVSTRLGEFKRGIAKEGETREGIQKATLASRDVTLDFSRRGSQTKEVNQLAAFFNANLQGIDKTIRVMRQNPVRTTARAAMYYTIPTILLYLLNRENPYYEEKEEWQKDLFWFIPLDLKNPKQSKHFLWVPKGHALAMIFASAPERIMRWIDKDDPHAFDEFAQRLLQTASPPNPIPTAAIPILEIWSNYNFFTDMPVVPAREQKLLPEDQYDIYTSDTARVIGKWTNQSPRQIDHLIRGYTAGLGTLVRSVTTDPALRAAEKLLEGDQGPRERPSKGLAEYPFFRSFLRDNAGPGAGSSIDQFYNLLEKAEGVNQRLKRDVSEGRAVDLSDNDKQLLAQVKGLRKVDQVMQDLRAARRKVENDPNMDGKEKREAINEIELAMTNLARQVLGKAPINE